MSCLEPIFIRSKAQGAPNGSMQRVPCGKCVGCLRDRQDRWVYRLQREQATSKHSLFVTLTYDESNVLLLRYKMKPRTDDFYDLRDPRWIRYKDYIKTKCIDDVAMSVNPRELTNYFKRLRKRLPGVRLSYYSCGEYGDQFGRSHYHFVIFYDADSAKVENAIQSAWNFGFVTIEPLIDSRITYVTKYIMKYGEEAPPDDNCLPTFQRSSQGLGINGFMYDYRFSGYSIDSCQLNSGAKIPIPRYFRQKFNTSPVFNYVEQCFQESQQNKREREKFNSYYQDYKIRTGESDVEKARIAYLQDSDSAAQRDSLLRAHRRRKGM